MKKLIYFVISCFSFLNAFNTKQADELGMIALKEDVFTALEEPLIPFEPSERQIFGAWYLYHFDEDEFFIYTKR